MRASNKSNTATHRDVSRIKYLNATQLPFWWQIAAGRRIGTLMNFRWAKNWSSCHRVRFIISTSNNIRTFLYYKVWKNLPTFAKIEINTAKAGSLMVHTIYIPCLRSRSSLFFFIFLLSFTPLVRTYIMLIINMWIGKLINNRYSMLSL